MAGVTLAVQRRPRVGLCPVVALLGICAFLVAPAVLSLLILTSRYGGLDLLQLWNAGLSVIWLVSMHSLVERPARLHLLLAPFYLIVATDLFLILHLKARLTSSYLTIILTNIEETNEFVRAYQLELVCMLAAVLGIYGFGLTCPPTLYGCEREPS